MKSKKFKVIIQQELEVDAEKEEIIAAKVLKDPPWLDFSSTGIHIKTTKNVSIISIKKAKVGG